MHADNYLEVFYLFLIQLQLPLQYLLHTTRAPRVNATGTRFVPTHIDRQARCKTPSPPSGMRREVRLNVLRNFGNSTSEQTPYRYGKSIVYACYEFDIITQDKICILNERSRGP